jgi:hypothetical protein
MKQYPEDKHYLGDSVYVRFDGYALVLTTENGDGFPVDEIVLEPEVAGALISFIDRLKAEG